MADISLKSLALKFCQNAPESTFIDENLNGDEVVIREDIYLPQNLCEPLFENILETRPLSYMAIFRDRSRCQLTKLNLSNKKISRYQNLVSDLLYHRLQDIDLSNAYLDKDTATQFEKLSQCLESLNLSRTKGTWKSEGAEFLKKLANVKILDVSFVGSPIDSCIESISCMRNLAWLDISGCYSISSLVPLLGLKETLEHLYMYDVGLASCDELIEVIPELKALTHLDISRELDSKERQIFVDPITNTEILRSIGCLPCITFLDLSGCSGLKGSNMDALKMSLNRKLQFLGLFGTSLEGHQDLPAENVSGIANEQQILNTLKIHIKRSDCMKRALGFLYEFVSTQNFEFPENALKLILDVSKMHLPVDAIQLGASACIFHLLRVPEAENFSLVTRRSTIVTLLEIVESHKLSSILKNCLQCLCIFNFPTEMEFALLRLSKQLLRILKEYREARLCRVAVLLLNVAICHTSTIKLEAGQFGAIKILLSVIQDKVGRAEIDNVLETCWCALWNITDECPENCEAFINANGMTLFKECLNEFEDETELQRSMLGLMGNIAEVKSLRCNFLDESILEMFIMLLDSDKMLLDSDKYDFEVCYNAGGVLSHVCSDGDDVWTSRRLPRQTCMEAVIDSVGKWNVGSSRNINYRSLKPILKLVPLDYNRCGQEWALWALANLTKVYPEKYSKLLESEGGPELLKEVLVSQRASRSMKYFAEMTLEVLSGNSVVT